MMGCVRSPLQLNKLPPSLASLAFPYAMQPNMHAMQCCQDTQVKLFDIGTYSLFLTFLGFFLRY